MISKAKGRFIPVTPRKARLVARMLRGMEVTEAQVLLRHLPKEACRPLGKVLASAVANATREGAWTEEQLYISKIMADEGPMQKRYRAAPMGRATEIRKRMCHLTIELDGKGKPSKVRSK